MEIIIGTAAGLLVAALCAFIYTKGVRDGMELRKKKLSAGMEDGEDAQSELMRKYEMIMSYDPYCEKPSDFWGGNNGDSE